MRSRPSEKRGSTIPPRSAPRAGAFAKRSSPREEAATRWTSSGTSAVASRARALFSSRPASSRSKSPPPRRELTAGTSPRNAPDEERAELLDELGRLAGFSHRLHDVRERVQVFADEADHEVVVVLVEPVTGEPHVVSEILRAVSASDGPVLAQDAPLFARVELREGAASPERVPHRPGVCLVEDGLLRTIEEPEDEVALIAGAVGAAEHRELGAPLETE